MKVTIDDDGWGFETETAHYTHDGHYGKSEKQLKADVAEIVRILSCGQQESRGLVMSEDNRDDLDCLVRLVDGHIIGDGCTCSACVESECRCPNADWRSRHEVALTFALEYCLKRLKDHHLSITGIPETIRNTEKILDAGNYRKNAASLLRGGSLGVKGEPCAIVKRL